MKLRLSKRALQEDFQGDFVKMMLEASVEQFFQRDVLISNQLSYKEALEEVVGILMDGIAV